MTLIDPILDTAGRLTRPVARTEAKMLDELSKIDTSSIDDLQRIKGEEDALQERLNKMETMKGKVSDIVFQRVRQDYEAQFAVLEEEARPLKGRARGEYTKLIQHHSQLEAAVEAARLDKEEVDFRRQLGEFTDKEYEDRLGSMAKDLKGRERHLADCEKLRTHFLEAFHSEEELLQEEAGAPPTPGPGSTSSDEPSTAAEAVRESIPDPATIGPANGATMIIPPATLIVQAGDRSGAEVHLGLQPMTIGRASDSGLRLDVKGVSSHHAEISFGEGGYQIRDENSRKGLYVNGVQITSRVLTNGDLIELGSSEAQLIFRTQG